MKQTTKYKMLYLIIAFISISSVISAQNISKIEFKQSGQNIIINYKLSLLAYNEQAEISVYVSMDGGKTFTGALKEVKGDVGKNILNGKKEITWDAFREIPNFQGDIVFDIKANISKIEQKSHFYLSYTGSLEAPIGVTIGILNRFGFYLSTRINPSYFISSTYKTDGTTVTDYDQNGYYRFSGNQTNKRLAVTLGISKQLTKNIHIYAGGGIADYALLWELYQYNYNNYNKNGSSYAKHINESFFSYELEAGLKLHFSKLLISGGVSTPAFKWFEFVGSIGFVF